MTDQQKAQEYAIRYLGIFAEIENTEDDDMVEHMEQYAIDLEDDLTENQKTIYYSLINEEEF